MRSVGQGSRSLTFRYHFRCVCSVLLLHVLSGMASVYPTLDLFAVGHLAGIGRGHLLGAFKVQNIPIIVSRFELDQGYR